MMRFMSKFVEAKNSKDVVSQFLVYFVRIVLGVFVGAYVARYLGASDYGAYSLIIAFIALVSPIIEFGTKNILVKSLSVNEPYFAKEFWSLIFIKSIISMLLCVGVVTFYLTNNSDPLSCGIVVAIIMMMLAMPLKQFEVFVITHQKNSSLVMVQTSTLVVISLIKIVLVLKEANLDWFVYLYFVDLLVMSLLVAHVGYKAKLVPRLAGLDIWRGLSVIKDGWKLMVSALATVLYMKMDVFMIDHYMSGENVGYYAVAASVTGMAYFIPTALSRTYSQGIYKQLSLGRSESSVMMPVYSIFFWLSCLTMMLMVVFGIWGVPLLYGGEYAQSRGLLIVLSLSVPAVAFGMSRNIFLTYHKKYKFMLFSSLLGLVLNFCVNIILIPKIGVVGAAISSVFSHWVTAFLTSSLLREYKVLSTQINSIWRPLKDIRAKYKIAK